MSQAIALAFGILLLALSAYAVPDADTEQRCKNIDAMGGANACRCSEPLITNDTVVSTAGGHYWNPSGSVTKPCAASDSRAIAYEGGRASFVPLTGGFAAPGGISYGFQDTLPSESGYAVIAGASGSVPTNVGRVCHRIMYRLGSTWDHTPTCQSVKVTEFNPTVFAAAPAQWQAGYGNGTDGNLDMYVGGGSGVSGGGFFTNTSGSITAPIHASVCVSNWCAVEQCWYGNFSTGLINPIERMYAINPTTGAVVVQSTGTYTGVPISNTITETTPVTFQFDASANFYRATTGSPGCLGARTYVYNMEATFATADDATADHGPWIGPPLEMTGSVATTPIISLSPATLSPSVAQGLNATSQSFTITNTGIGSLSYAVTDGNTFWLSQTPATGTTSGSTPVTVTVAYNTAGLAVGTYTKNITVTDPGATPTSQTVAVTLTVTAATPSAIITLDPTTITPQVTQGGTPPNQVFRVTNSGGGSLAYTVTKTQSWLGVTPLSGVSTGEADTITVSFPGVAALAPGFYADNITVAGGSGITSQAVAVTVNVSPTGAASPTICCKCATCP